MAEHLPPIHGSRIADRRGDGEFVQRISQQSMDAVFTAQVEAVLHRIRQQRFAQAFALFQQRNRKSSEACHWHRSDLRDWWAVRDLNSRPMD